ncbi:MAG: hypothetical protein NC393_01490 [Clostridium sp.]|nr:hypothetical protein [Clostridium sp.]MCM1208584.1 hypothetical protein [Ruminococcus sp.]
MKDKSKRFFVFLPYIIFGIVMIFYHVAGYELLYDDIVVANKMPDTFSALISNIDVLAYENWSSRVLINPLIWIVSFFGVPVWLVLDILVMLFLFWSINRLLFQGKDIKFTYITLLVLLSFPFYIDVTVGWVVTTMTYLWPLAAILAACFPIRNYFDGKQTGILQAVLSVLLTVYATNKEELSVMMFVVFLTMFVMSVKEKKISYVFLMQWVVSAGALVFHMMSQDNQARSVSKGESLMVLDKVELGFSATIVHLFDNFSFMTLWFVLLLVIGVCIMSKKVSHILISAIPLVVWIINCFGEDKQFFGLYDRNMYSFEFAGPLFVSEGKYNSLSSWSSLLVAIVLIACVTASVVFIFGGNKKTILLVSLLVGGFGGRMTAGFGELGWMPLSRTFTFFYFAMAMMIMLIAYECVNKLKARKQDALIGLLIGIAMLSVAINIIMLGIVDLGLD